MKISIISCGSRGDVQPYIALGTVLRNHGYQVSIATHENFRELVESYGLGFALITGNPHELLNSDEGQKMLESGTNSLRSVRIFLSFYRSLLEEFMQNIMDICQGTDAIIYSITAIPSYFIAQSLGIPSIAAYLQPFSRTSDFPSFLAPYNLKLGKSYNLFTHYLSEQLIWQPVRPVINKWIKKNLGITPAPFTGMSGTLWKNRYPIIYGYSQTVVPKPKEWGEWIKITGYWYLDHSLDWQADPGMLDFLDNGPAPVYIGFGSMVNRNPEETTETVVKALKKSKLRAVLMSGWGGLAKEKLSDDIYITESVPHDWLFPQMAAVVHHGGAGTSSAGLRAGVPSIVIPFFGDQFFWAERLSELGVGPGYIPRKKLNDENLSNALIKVTEEQDIQLKASRIGQKIRSEEGSENAAKIITEILNKSVT